MIAIVSSKAVKANQGLRSVPRKASEDNLAWLARNLPAPDENASSIVIVGGRGPLAFRLRAAQAHIRHDLVASYWSHVMLLGRVSPKVGNTPVHEISLEPSAGFGFPPPSNGVQTGRLAAYRNAEAYPNICVLNVPVALDDVMGALGRFKMQRAVLDAVDLLVRWIAFGWGVTQSGNPLLDNNGMPSAAMLEVVFGAVGFDLTPGLESRASCPEAIWQAAKWWHTYYEEQKREPLTGAYHCPHAF